MGIKANIEVYVDVYLTEEGVGVYVSADESGFSETTIPYNKLVEEFLEAHQIPSTPPTMNDEDRERVTNLYNIILSALDHLRKLEHETPTWKKKDYMGHRD